jgi:hypothetical protein
MPKLVKEVASGVQYDFSAEEGQIAASTTRVFKILKSNTNEYISIASACGVQVGQQHPTESGMYCVSYSAQYDGDSRMVIVATFNYRSSPGLGGDSQDRKQSPPDVRPANWSVATSLQETPAYIWKAITGPDAGTADAVGPCVNPSGDLYEGVVRLEPIVTIAIEQFETVDPTRHCLYAGYVNSNSIQLGSLAMFPRSVMFRGVQTQPAIEQWGDTLFRGWKASYEFAFRVNWVGAPVNQAIGWDVLQPQSGFNVKAWAPLGPNGSQVANDRDDFGQPLEPDNFRIKIPVSLPSGVSPGDKMRAHIRVASGEGGVTQRPSAQPIALNDDGAARSPVASPKVLVYRYQVQNDINFSIFGLRLG